MTKDTNYRTKVTLTTWQQVGKGGIWSHLAPPQSGPHLSFNFIQALSLKRIIRKGSRGRFWTHNQAKVLPSILPGLSCHQGGQGNHGSPAEPKHVANDWQTGFPVVALQ